MRKKKHLPKEVVETKQMRVKRLQKECEEAVKRGDPQAEKLAEQLVQAHIAWGASISEHFVPLIKEKDKQIKKLKRKLK